MILILCIRYFHLRVFSSKFSFCSRLHYTVVTLKIVQTWSIKGIVGTVFQAFSGDSCEQQDALRERVVDLLFSRVTLQPLQNYVCTQVEAALER